MTRLVIPLTIKLYLAIVPAVKLHFPCLYKIPALCHASGLPGRLLRAPGLQALGT